jgi:hypothetical protein
LLSCIAKIVRSSSSGTSTQKSSLLKAFGKWVSVEKKYQFPASHVYDPEMDLPDAMTSTQKISCKLLT